LVGRLRGLRRCLAGGRSVRHAALTRGPRTEPGRLTARSRARVRRGSNLPSPTDEVATHSRFLTAFPIVLAGGVLRKSRGKGMKIASNERRVRAADVRNETRRKSILIVEGAGSTLIHRNITSQAATNDLA